MANPLFEQYGKPQPPAPTPPPQGDNFAQNLQALQNNPLGILRSLGLNLPDNLNSPQGILNYLMQSGQVSGAELNRVRNLACTMGYSF